MRNLIYNAAWIAVIIGCTAGIFARDIGMKVAFFLIAGALFVIAKAFPTEEEKIVKRYSDVNTIRTLVERGEIDPKGVFAEGITPLMLASEIKGNVETVTYLLKNGAEVNRQDVYGLTALMYAVRNGDRDIVRALIDAGADCELKNNDGLSPVDFATSEEIKSMILSYVRGT